VYEGFIDDKAKALLLKSLTIGEVGMTSFVDDSLKIKKAKSNRRFSKFFPSSMFSAFSALLLLSILVMPHYSFAALYKWIEAEAFGHMSTAA
jgi:hypothetical protein